MTLEDLTEMFRRDFERIDNAIERKQRAAVRAMIFTRFEDYRHGRSQQMLADGIGVGLTEAAINRIVAHEGPLAFASRAQFEQCCEEVSEAEQRVLQGVLQPELVATLQGLTVTVTGSSCTLYSESPDRAGHRFD